jgi:hypothetical protein
VTSSYDIAISGDLKDTDPGAGEGVDMARLIGAQRMVLQAILDLPKDTAGFVKDTQIAQSTEIATSDVRDWIETLEGEGYVEVARTGVGLSASTTAQGKLILRQFQPFGSTPPPASQVRPPTPPAGGSLGHLPAPQPTPPQAVGPAPSPGSSSGQGTSPGATPMATSATSTPKAPVEVFYSYSHKDEALREELEEALALLKRQGHIAGWHDRAIIGGQERADQISEHLESARIVLLLVSSSFLASDYCFGKEMGRALERHDKKEAVVIPVIVRPCDWHGAPFAKLQGLPKDAKAVTSWANKDEAWTDVAKGVRRAVESMTENPR